MILLMLLLLIRMGDLACMFKLFGRVTDGHKTIGEAVSKYVLLS